MEWESLLWGKRRRKKKKNEMTSREIPAIAKAAVLAKSTEEGLEGAPVCVGADFNREVTLDSLMASYATTGFQATSLAQSIAEINRMLDWKPTEQQTKEADEAGSTSPRRCVIFLG